MKKTTITFLISALMALGGLKAQSVQEGMNYLYADRFKSAISVFQKLLATNPNNIEATYWLGQTFLDLDDNAKADELYTKAIAASANAPLLLVGKGHVELLNKKTDEARQHFEAALTMTRTKKGDDPLILTAIGRANVDAKAGDIAYAVEKLEAAVLRDPKNTETYLQLGNAYRKLRPGEGGGQAFLNYKKALEINPNFAVASVRLAKLFESQKNWDLVIQYLTDAVTQDPKFSLAYHELFYYYFFRQNYAEAESQLKKLIESKLPEDDIQDQSLYAQLCWARKDFDCAIAKDLAVVASQGEHPKPKVLKLLADAYYQKADYANAKKFIDDYMTREKNEDKIAYDYKLKADIYAKLGTPSPDLYSIYMEGAAMDTVVQSRIDYMTVAADSFKARGSKKQEADMRLAIYKTRLKPQPGGLINIGILYTQCGELPTADSLFKAYTVVMPDSVYGYVWRGRVNFTQDTTMTVEPFVSNMVTSFQKALDIAYTDKVRMKSQGINASITLAGYFYNIKKDKETALMYTRKGLEFDSTNGTLKSILPVLTAPSRNPAPRGNVMPEAVQKAGTPADKPAAVKPRTSKAPQGVKK